MTMYAAPQKASSHSTQNCQLKQVIRSAIVTEDYDEAPQEDYSTPEPFEPVLDFPEEDQGDLWPDDQEEEQSYGATPFTTFRMLSVVRIRKVNVYKSPILSLSFNGITVHVDVDTRATSSCMSFKMASKLGLNVQATNHTAVQVDGGTPLQAIGKVHTTFYRGNKPLTFSGLVIETMSVDILGGGNFITENDLSLRPKKKLISIGDHATVMATSPTILQMDQLDFRKRLVATQRSLSVVPGDPIQMRVPFDMPANCHIAVQPNYQQAKDFMEPQLIEVRNGMFTIFNESNDILKVKKNCQLVNVKQAYDWFTFNSKLPPKLPPVERRTYKEVIKEMNLDDAKNLDKATLDFLQSVVKENLDVFQPDFPGYNQIFGPLHGSLILRQMPDLLLQKFACPPTLHTANTSYLSCF